MKTPITIITGYLGAGKTTLLKNIIDNSSRKIAVVMNEFGEINIDGNTIKGKNIDMVELQNGCVCCSLTGEFEIAIKELIEKAKPDAIIVETTGVAEPDAVVIDIQDNLPEVRLDAVITIADADAILKFPTIGNTGKMQLEMADIILLNKTDLISEQEIAKAEEKVKAIKSSAIIFRTVKCKIINDYLFGIETKKAAKEHHHHKIKENCFYYKSDKIIDGKKFADFVSSMPKNIYRAKGFIRLNNGSFLFNYVAGRYDFEKFDAEKTELVFIGENADKVKDSIIKKLKSL
ncbi:GTP-binding protein [Candidatus Woesearchaeota archaeon]|nr:GTP-binding protein [Candidatus Woesearchaeota archaeon]